MNEHSQKLSFKFSSDSTHIVNENQENGVDQGFSFCFNSVKSASQQEQGNRSVTEHNLVTTPNISDDESAFPSKIESKIVLETMSKKQTLCVMGITWSSFIIATILLLVLLIFETEPRELTFLPCQNVTSSRSSSCLNIQVNEDSLLWEFNANISEDLDTLAGFISLDVYLFEAAVDAELSYDLSLIGCTQHRESCTEDEFLEILRYNERAVRVQDNDDGVEPENTDLTDSTVDSKVEFFKIFQNQETLTTTGSISEYQIKVNVYGDISSASFLDRGNIYSVVFNVDSYAVGFLNRGTVAFLVILFGFGSVWVWLMFKIEPNIFLWLHERKWLLVVLVGIVCIANPLYVSESYLDTQVPILVFTSILILRIGVALVAYVFLLFSGGTYRIAQEKSERWRFYLPKVIPSFLYITAHIGLELIHFPSISGVARNGIDSAYLWDRELQRIYVGMSLFAVFEVINLGLSLYKVLTFAIGREAELGDFTTKANSILRLPESNFSRLLLVMVVIIVQLYAFLPPKYGIMLGANQNLQFLLYEYQVPASLHRQNAKEHDDLSDKAEEDVMVQMNKSFVAETALKLFEFAWEVYADPPNLQTKSSSGKKLNIARLGFEIVDWIYNEDKEVNCLVARHIISKELVVAFRGTNSREQWNSNLNYFAIPFNADKCCMAGMEDELPDSITGNEDIRDYENEHFGMFDSSTADTEGNIREPRFNWSPRSPRISFQSFWKVMQAVEEGGESMMDGAEMVGLGNVPLLENIVVTKVHRGFLVCI
mmetsp:Transcript_12200/g.16001  ORF Transcript_12200/g.16001 Transcript_12200/m.16001 type:complete len:769 (-) Transcript_12200:9-2315(-)